MVWQKSRAIWLSHPKLFSQTKKPYVGLYLTEFSSKQTTPHMFQYRKEWKNRYDTVERRLQRSRKVALK